MNWSARYTGLPWKPHGRTLEGVDCWGLVRLILAEERKLELPSYDAVNVWQRAEMDSLIQQHKSDWVQVSLDATQPFDVLSILRGGYESHVGVVVKRGLMLHIVKSQLSCVERFDTAAWKPSIVGAYRHV